MQIFGSIESQAFASTKSCTLVAKIFNFRLELIPLATSLRFHKVRISKKIAVFDHSKLAPYVPLNTHTVDESLDRVKTFQEKRHTVC